MTLALEKTKKATQTTASNTLASEILVHYSVFVLGKKHL